jgi:hypothetical protein
MGSGEPAALGLQTLIPGNAGGLLGKVLSAGLKKSKPFAIVLEPRAKFRVTAAAPVFYARPPEGVAPEDIALVAIKTEDDHREMPLAPSESPAAKPAPASDALRPLKTEEVGPKLYRMVVPPLQPGEYVFYLRGSADPSKGTQGKGYDFAVDSPAKK